MLDNEGWLNFARRAPCEHFDMRQDLNDISLLVIHNISLPPNQFGGDHIESFFAGILDKKAHPYFEQIAELRVSSHLLIKRTGEVVQFVSLFARAWHAGVSSFQGRTRCNDFSIGIELEGTDNTPYTLDQYKALTMVSNIVVQHFSNITLGRIVGHNDIAPGRKTDPGVAFDWARLDNLLALYRRRLFKEIV